MAAVSCSSSAATSALDSMYRMLASTAFPGRRLAPALRARAGDGRLRFATVAVYQFSRGARRQPDVRPVLERIPALGRGMENAGGDEFVPPASRELSPITSRRNQFGDHTSVGCHGNPFAGFDPAEVAAQVVAKVPDTGAHASIIATCGYIAKSPV